ncbi:MAG: PaaI family thioesterase [Roseobacter sp.]
MNSATRTRIEQSFAAQSMLQTFGATLARVAESEIWIRSPILPGTRQQQGFPHAGLTFSIGDSAAGYAALSTMPHDLEVVTAEIKINLLAPARGDHLLAKGRIIKPGRRLTVVAAEVLAIDAGAETLIAVLQGTMMPVPR